MSGHVQVEPSEYAVWCDECDWQWYTAEKSEADRLQGEHECGEGTE